jgi:4-hydroxybenzoate polyprenyltransferase
MATVVSVNVNTFIILLLANTLVVSSTFIMNDIGDSGPDKHDDYKKNRNALSVGTISKKEGYILFGVFGVITATLYYLLNFATMVVGLMIFAFGILYSLEPFRLKQVPPYDMILHVLGGMITLTVFTAFDYYGYVLILPMSIAFINSAYVQFNNQIRDFDVDKKANVKTTVNVLGFEKSKKIRATLGVLFTILLAYLVMANFETILVYKEVFIVLVMIALLLYSSKIIYMRRGYEMGD